MPDARPADVLRLCGEALTREGADREAYLDAACGPQSELRREVEALLEQQASSGDGFLDTPPWVHAAPALGVGQRLGPYEVTGSLGAGGMGEVYKARDTRLGRTVAIKVLPPALAGDPHRRHRFEQEARAVSALNHPHICTLHDIGVEDGIDYLVLEYCEGESLAERLARKGRLPVEQVLEYGAQIAEALAAAHRQGVVHRDLKPDNVMITKAGAKLLDFGLARLTEPAPGSGATAAVSTAGVVIGTLPYMAPEQVQGLPCDARTDTFAFGAVAYEMVTGTRAFEGQTATSVAAAILEHHPAAMSSLQPVTPPALDRLVTRCLAKDPDARWQSMADVADELRWLAAGSGAVVATPGLRARRPVYWKRPLALVAVLAVGVVAGAAAAAFLTRGWRPAGSGPAVHVAIPVSTFGLVLDSTPGGLALSPDGQTLVFAASRPGNTSSLWVRRLDDPEPRPLKGTEGARLPFFSPDGNDVAFSVLSDGGLCRVSVNGGAPEQICLAPEFEGGVWGPDGIVYAGGYQKRGLWKVSPDGGEPTALFQVAKAERSSRESFPDLLPGGKDIIFTTRTLAGSHVNVWSPERGVRVLMPGGRARYLSSGHLLYEDGETLRIVAFDPQSLEIAGPSRVVLQGVRTGLETAAWSVSGEGALAYQSAYTGLTRLVWRDRQGRASPVPLKPRRYGPYPALSRHDGRLVVPVWTATGLPLFIGTPEREPLSLLSSATVPEMYFPSFSTDGRWVLFTGGPDEQGRYNIFRVRADGGAPPERLTEADEPHGAAQLSPDGKVLLLNVGEGNEFHLWEKRLSPAGPLRPLVRTPGVRFEANARFSPDGAWLAYVSSEGGINEIWVRAYGADGARHQVSTDGGKGPIWHPRGHELFYQGPQGMMSVAFLNGRPGLPAQLFPMEATLGPNPTFDISPDGERFLIVEREQSDQAPSQIYLVLNWAQGLEAKATTGR